MKRAPKRARPLGGLALRLCKALGEPLFQAWFGDAEFDEGPPAKIIMATRFKRSHAEENFGDHLRQIFGDHLILGYAAESGMESRRPKLPNGA
jgi:chromosomal replication initiation ATPase DnaA